MAKDESIHTPRPDGTFRGPGGQTGVVPPDSGERVDTGWRDQGDEDGDDGTTTGQPGEGRYMDNDNVDAIFPRWK